MSAAAPRSASVRDEYAERRPSSMSWNFSGLPVIAGDRTKFGATPERDAPQRSRLTVGAKNDPLGREADAVAGAVASGERRPVAMPALEASGAGLWTKAVGDGVAAFHAPAAIQRVLQTPGRSLDADARDFMESRMGHDFSAVRVHADAEAARSARAIGALAYTVGRHVVFDAPHGLASQGGRRLLAHELAHVVQQGGAHSDGDAHRLQRQPAPAATTESAPQAEDPEKAAASEEKMIVAAARRCRKNPADRTSMMLGAAEIGYRFIALELPDYKDRVSGVGYDEKLKGVRVEARRNDIDITLGKDFVLAVDDGTLAQRGLELAAAVLAKAPRKNAERGGALFQMHRDMMRAPGPEIGFDEALKEGGEVLHNAEFGNVCGRDAGPDAADGYDSREWEEQAGRGFGVITAKTEPWLAFYHLVENVKRGVEVPAASGGRTKWSFECFSFVVLNRVYAQWRTMTRSQFNASHSPMELGIRARINAEWNKPVEATNPKEKPFVSTGEFKPGTLIEDRRPVGKGWDELINSAPIGTQITWGNQDAKDKCRQDGTLSFCAFVYENTTKVGQNLYSAHPFGLVTREFIEDKMAEAVLSAENKPITAATKHAYIKKFVYISGMRTPKDRPSSI
jgi:hypothetical protein